MNQFKSIIELDGDELVTATLYLGYPDIRESITLDDHGEWLPTPEVEHTGNAYLLTPERAIDECLAEIKRRFLAELERAPR
jgi:hypothetical protein